jgi:PAS domain-containing protein
MRYRGDDNAELRKSEELFRIISASVTDVIWTSEFDEPIDASHLLGQDEAATKAARLLLERRFTYFSPSVERLLGYSAAEALKLGIRDFATPESLGTSPRRSP